MQVVKRPPASNAPKVAGRFGLPAAPGLDRNSMQQVALPLSPKASIRDQAKAARVAATNIKEAIPTTRNNGGFP
jgi:hypothetical protein